MKFIKMHVSGNDFVITENTSKLTINEIKKISDRKKGIGFDQLIVINKFNKENNEAEIKIYNADGSIAETCLNGTLCVAQKLMKKWSLNEIKIKSFNQVFNCNLIKDDTVKLKLTVPSFDWKHIKLEEECDTLNLKFPEIPYEVVGLSLGNPHIVIFVNETKKISQLDFFTDKINHSNLLSNSVNISVCYIDRNNIHARIYERGVGETLSCGSAAACIYFAAKAKNFIQGYDEISIIFPGGITKILTDANQQFLLGKVNIVFSGIIEELY
jgi:diaminopimelate epimerase